MQFEKLFAEDIIDRLRGAVCDSRRVVITCHISPDGDALGSSLAMMHMLRNSGRVVHVVTPDTPPASLTFLPGAAGIVSGSTHADTARNLIASCDLLICSDYSQPGRIDKLAPALEASEAVKVVIDHHLEPTIPCDILLSRPEQSSTCALLFHVLAQLGELDRVDITAGECLLTGMMTDTGNFTYNALDPQLYLIQAWLVARGVDKERLYRKLFNTTSLHRLQLNAYALGKLKVYPEHKATIIALTNDELRSFNYQKGDTEGLVNVPLGMPEIVYSIFLREDRRGESVRVSVRSRANFRPTVSVANALPVADTSMLPAARCVATSTWQ